MLRFHSDLMKFAGVALALLAAPASTAAQAPGVERAARIVSSEISISRDNAELDLELDDGRELEYAIRGGTVYVEGRSVGSAARGDQLDRSWRALLNAIMDVPTHRLPAELAAWQAPPGSAGTRLDSALESAVAGLDTTAAPGALAGDTADLDLIVAPGLSDRVQELESEKERLEREVRELRERREARDREFHWTDPIEYVWEQFIDILQILAMFIFIAALGLFVVLIAGRYTKTVSDGVRAAPVRSWAVGFAATFLAIPVYVLGLLALAISIIGIPAILVWAPLFPLAFAIACVYGYLTVAHAVGEALVGWKLRKPTWFELNDSFYYMTVGIGVLLVPLIAAVVLNSLRLPVVPELLGILQAFITWVAFSIGLGAVLLTRAGTRPIEPFAPAAPVVPPAPMEEPSNV